MVYPFTFESFTPELLVPKNGRRRERMERMKETFSRVSSFLRNSGASHQDTEVPAVMSGVHWNSPRVVLFQTSR